MSVSDSNRKIFRTLYNYFSKNHSMPTIALLCRFSNRNQEQIVVALQELEAAGYIEWDGQQIESVKMIKFQEPDSKHITPGSAQRYFMDY